MTTQHVDRLERLERRIAALEAENTRLRAGLAAHGPDADESLDRFKEELRAGAEINDRILAASSDCIKVLDLEARLQFMSPGGHTVMELDDFETLRGRSFVDLWTGEDRETAEAALASARSGHEARFRGHALTAKGTPRWWDVVVTPIHGPDGRPEKLLAVSRDITAEHQAQDAVRRSEERLRNVLTIRTVGVMFWGEGFGLTDMNEAFLRMTGFTREEALGKTWQELTPPEFHEASWKAVGEVTTLGETTPYEKQYYRKDGSRWWGLFAARRVGDEVVEFVLDITARKEAEKALRLSEARFRAAVEAMQGRLWTNDDTGQMVGDQPGWAALTGQSFDEYQGYGWTGAVHPDDVHPTVEAWRAAVAERRPFFYEHRVRRQDGVWRLFSVRAIPARDDMGEVREWVGIHTDITDRRVREAELRELNETLEMRVAQALAERAHAEEALRQSQKMEAVGQLTGGLAHDFNNLLTGITGSLDLMGNRLRQGRTADLERYIGAAMTSAQRAAALTHRLLAFSRRQPLDPKPVEANRLLAGMEDLLQRTHGPGITLEMKLAGNLWRTLCDPVQLESAILNLCLNARDAMPEGGMLTIETANLHLEEACVAQHDMRPGSYVTVSVTDTGAGMSPQVLERAFDPFFTTKPIGQGTGLGLSMVYGFAKQSEGHVRVISREGQGTTVKLYLPRHRGEASDDDERMGLVPVPRAEAGETVLVVEDEPVVRALIVEVLRDLGYRAIEAADGPSGLRLAQSRQRIDLLVTDVGLPGLNGRQLADQARLARPDLKVLFITGYAENTTQAGGFLEPGMGMMTKPFSVDALMLRIRAMIEERAG
ncbi:PAS domain-containing sensor histidine kinase [Rubellimicrobium roseum]|uniref:histidine kinase n=1 Tax=Rubellimicrobium roseum TaxID=687525 RepID=A0A5C4NB22_9RHOB|nr:PAS domain-containing sensor histidine kinase [Rubellimicrobium roseum]TNC66573.1 PAS domain S-box protein [Rubellimicrobium roseum]